MMKHNFKNIKLYQYSDFLVNHYDDFSNVCIPHMVKTPILMRINIEPEK